MGRWWAACWALWLTVALAPGCTEGGSPSDAGGDAGGLPDRDRDGISDMDEDLAGGVDSDGDGWLDAEDSDSDGDGLSDAIEAGDSDIDTPPRDTDGDGLADFRDVDSDGNGIPDGAEGTGDTDGDGVPDFRDADDDGDFVTDVLELDGLLWPPADSDGDGAPDYLDPDSDDDRILDGDEPRRDTDGDGLLDGVDLDSDGDGISDRDEAGDADLYSPPIDTDGDLVPDFLDPDSDGDGLSDAAERVAGTSPVAMDSDGDGVSDLIEVGAGTDPLDPAVSPRTRGDFVFVVPYMEPPAPSRDTLIFRTNIQFADIYFLFDITGSMDAEISALRGAVTTLMSDIRCADSLRPCTRDAECSIGQVCGTFTHTCIEDSSVSGCLLSPWTGAGYYEAEYTNVVSLQADPGVTSAALGVATFGGTEALYRATWGVASPSGSPGAEVGCALLGPGEIGCPAFRSDAVRVMVVFTDENSDGPETATQAGDALRAEGITVIGVWSGTPTSIERPALVDLVRASGSVDRAGRPLVFDGADASIVPAVAAAIQEVVGWIPLRATISASDEPGDAGDALQFIDRLEVNISGGRCTSVAAVEDTDGDGHADAYSAVLPGTPVCWDVVAARNDTVMPTAEPQLFRARLTVRGNGSPLDSRTVYFLVPPVIELPGPPS